MIVPLNLPKADLKLKRKNDQVFVWCIIRKKELVCTPEEWVRQHLIHFLIHFKNVPVGLIASEYALNYNGLLKRADIVVFSKNGEPLVIIECKSTDVAISSKTLDQIAQYNSQLNVRYLMLSNGIDHYVGLLKRETNELTFLNDLPCYENLEL